MKRSKLLKLMAISGLGLIVLASVLLAGCPAPATTTPTGPTTTATATATPTGKEIKFTIVSIGNPYMVSAKATHVWIDGINERFKGRFYLDWLGGEEVCPLFEQPTAVKEGVFSMTNTSATYYATYVPAVRGYYLIYQPHAQRVSSGFEAWAEKRANDGGFHNWALTGGWNRLGYAIGYGPKVKPPTKYEDLKGWKIRTMELYTPFLKAMGCVTMTMPYSDIYEAVSKGMLDGYSGAMSNAYNYGFYEVGGGWIDIRFYAGCAASSVVNLKQWNAVPKDLQKAIYDTYWELYPETDRVASELQDFYVQKFLEAGLKPVVFSDAEKARYITLANDSLWVEVKKFVSESDYNDLKAFAAQGKLDWDKEDW